MLTDLLDPRPLLLAAVVVFLSAFPLAASDCPSEVFGGRLVGEVQLLTEIPRHEGGSGTIELHTFGWYRMFDGSLRTVRCTGDVVVH